MIRHGLAALVNVLGVLTIAGTGILILLKGTA